MSSKFKSSGHISGQIILSIRHYTCIMITLLKLRNKLRNSIQLDRKSLSLLHGNELKVTGQEPVLWHGDIPMS